MFYFLFILQVKCYNNNMIYGVKLNNNKQSAVEWMRAKTNLSADRKTYKTN